MTHLQYSVPIDVSCPLGYECAEILYISFCYALLIIVSFCTLRSHCVYFLTGARQGGKDYSYLFIHRQ